MSNKKEEDMLNEYPDLSDESDEQQPQRVEAKEENNLPNSQPHKIIKQNQPIQAPTSKPVFTAPLLFGGKAFIPPPPPPSSKGKTMNYPMPQPPPVNHMMPKPFNNPPPPQNTFKYNEQPVRQERQRKNCVYVKNIPKHYNEVDKLMTFFKNQGQVRQIKVNHEDSTAIVRFSKEEDAIKFINSNKAIFNRSFITYSLNEKDAVPIHLLKERQNEEAGKIRKPIEVEMKQSRERLETVLADKIRALLFLLKNIEDERAQVQLKEDLGKAIDLKKNLDKYGYQELDNLNRMTFNDYDWTLAYTTSKNLENEKKVLAFQLQKKFGPISTIDFIPINGSAQPKQENQESIEGVEQQTEFIVKITFLSIKSSWEFYYFKHFYSTETQVEEKGLEVEGSKIRSLFNEGIIKKPVIPIMTPPLTNKEEPKEELVELLENGEVRVLEGQGVVETQVDPGLTGKPQAGQPIQNEPSNKQGSE